jgi:membrane protein implicated in regulation of membrane protease activity
MMITPRPGRSPGRPRPSSLAGVTSGAETVTAAAPMRAVATLGHLLFVGADAAFYAVFGVFLVAFLVLVVITLRWAVRRDRAGRAEWLRRREESGTGAPETSSRVQTNGHVPRRKDEHGGNPRRSG